MNGRTVVADMTGIQSQIRELAVARNAVILAHNYQRPEVQDVADFVGDSLGLSREAAATEAEVIVFCGVHFMAETAAILSPEKKVLLPNLDAGCSLAATITAADVRKWKAEFPDHLAVGYVNTTAEVKAELDYCCTSGNALEVVDALPSDRGILFLPDFFLGAHIKRMRPERDIELWMGECHVHKNINARKINAMWEAYPEAEVLVHPECGCAGQLIYEEGCGDLNRAALQVTSTEGMVRAAQSNDAYTYVVATEVGILHRLRKIAPDKQFVAADPDAVCEYMKMIEIEQVRDALLHDQHIVTVPDEIAAKARVAIDRMVQIGR